MQDKSENMSETFIVKKRYIYVDKVGAHLRSYKDGKIIIMKISIKNSLNGIFYTTCLATKK